MPMPSNSSRRKTRFIRTLIAWIISLAGLCAMSAGITILYLGSSGDSVVDGGTLLIDKLLASLFVLLGSWAVVQVIFKR